MTNPMPWTPSRTERALKLWTDGCSATEIMRILGGGLTRNAVIGKLNRIGAPKRAPVARDAAAWINRPKSPAFNAWPQDKAEELRRLYVEEELNPTVIAERFGMGRTAITSKLIRMGVPMRPTVTAIKAMKAEAVKRQRENRSVGPIPVDIWAPIGPTVGLLDLHSHSCRWPIGDQYCGATKERGSYCGLHGAIAYSGIPAIKATRPHGMERRG